MSGFDLFTLAKPVGPVEVWPENWDAFFLFQAMQTQWRTGMSGASGLDYNVLFRLMDEAGFTGQEWQDVFADIQLMEIEALNTMHAQE